MLQGTDPRTTTDQLRQDYDVTQIDGIWTVLGHPEAMQVARDPHSYSSAVSRYLQLPNGLDGVEHSRFRALIDRYMTPSVVAGLEPVFAKVAQEVVGEAVAGTLQGETAEVDAVELGINFSVRAMTAWLGWPRDLEPRLVQWVRNNSQASRSRQQEKTAEVAADFDEIIREVVEPRLRDSSIKDVTADLVKDDFLGRKLTFEEIVSILRNWTGGDLSSMALCIGVVVQGLTNNRAVQDRIRGGVSTRELEAMIDEFLRIDSPFVTNRRVTTCPVTLAGQHIPAGEQININWTSANRDERIFEAPDAYDAFNLSKNLVWGAGPHECPGRDLSMAELRAFVTALIDATVVTPTQSAPVRARFPLGGYVSAPVVLNRI